MRLVINQVFTDLSDLINRRNNVNACGDPLDQECVNILVSEDNTIPCIAASSAYERNISKNSCNHLTVNTVYQKLNGGYINGKLTRTMPFDGLVCINTANINWNIDYNNGPGPNERDLKTAMLHEVIHLLGFVSLLNTSGGSLVPNYYEIFDEYLQIAQPNSSTTVPILINNSSCSENCWSLNTIFQHSPNFSNTIRDNCTVSGVYDIVFGSTPLAAIMGGSGFSPSNDKNDPQHYIGEMLSHLNPDCHGIAGDFIMQPNLPNGIRREITDAEKKILCALGYDIQNMSPCCFNIAYSEPTKTNDLHVDCCSKFFYTCVGKSIIIQKADLLCNDPSNGTQDITDFFTFPNNPDLQITNFNSSFVQITSQAQGPKIIYYTVTSCDCKMHNAYFTLNVGPCLNCNGTPACQNLLCTDDFHEFDINTGHSEPYLFPVATLSGGTYWEFTNSGINSADICSTPNGIRYLHMVAIDGGTNEAYTEGVCFQLKQAISSGCSMQISFNGARYPVNTILKIYGSDEPPCSALDKPVNHTCTPTNCSKTNPYNPDCIGMINIDYDGGGTGCGNAFTFQNYTRNFINGLSHDWKYITIFPLSNQGTRESHVFLSHISITKTCFCENDITETQISCPERSFQPNCIDAHHTYSWATSDGANGSGSNFNHVFQNGNYITTLTVVDECSNSIQFTKNVDVACGLNCNHCQQNSIILANSSKTKLSEYNITSIPWGSCIIVKDKLIIDVDNIVLNECTVYMEPGAEIYINSGITLTALHSIFTGCDYMWKSITAPTGSKFVLGQQSTIKDAWRGIDAFGSPTLDLTDNLFVNNYVGIYVGEGAVFTDYPIHNNYFYTEGPFKASYDFRSTPILGYAGVQVYGGNITLGSDGLSGTGNIFYNLNNGIVSESGRINIYNSDIHQMILLNHITPSALFDDGCGIYSSNSNLEAKYNSIYEASTAISCKGKGSKQTITESNNIDEVIFGINVSDVVNVIKINSNQISYYDSGIGVNNPKLLTQFEIIKNDPITQLYANSWLTGGIGIDLLEVKQIASNQYSKVTLNKLFHDENCIGFRINACEKIGLQENTITISGTSFNGIEGFDIENSNSCNFYNNSVTGLTTNFNTVNYACFDIKGSASNIFCNNHASGLPNGFMFRGTCTSDNNFRFNTMNNEKEGLLLLIANPPHYGPSVIGIQEFMSNEWNGSYTGNAASNFNSDQVIRLRSQFKVNSCAQPYWPESILPYQGPCDPLDPFASIKWFYRLNGGGSVVCIPPFGLNPDGDHDDDLQPDPEPITSNDIRTALGQFGEDYSPLNFEMPLDLYRKLNENPSLLNQNSSIDSFYEANHSTNIYKYYRVDSAIRFIFQFTNNERHILKALEHQSDSLKKFIRINDSLLTTVTTLPDSVQLANEKILLVTHLMEIFDQIDSLDSEVLETREALVSQIELWNDSIVPNGIVENNRKTSDQVLLQTVYHGTDHLTENQMNSISPIAWQCLLSGGRGVLIARELYQLNEVQQFNDEILCSPGELILETKNNRNIDSKYLIQPNPNKGSFYLISQNEITNKDLSLEIFNLDGKKLYHKKINFEKQKFIEINPDPKLVTGLYFVKILDKNDLLFTSKMVIE